MKSPVEEFPGTERFAVQRRLGAGGMGVVYEAVDRERDLTVALKTIRQYDPSALYRFKREFRSLEDVVHPNLVRLWELFSDGDRWFFTMELVEGTDFLRYVRPTGADNEPTRTGNFEDETFARKPRSASFGFDPAETEAFISSPRQSGLDLERLYSALLQLTEGLNALHAMGKVHRDLKPSNVMVDYHGRVVVLDFGLSTELERLEDPRATEQGIVGTISYMSPEQAAGEPASAASDWYCVGVMLFQALTGHLPFEGNRIEVLCAKQTKEAPDPASLAADLPEDLRLLCLDLLQRNPEARPDGDDVLQRLGGRASLGLHTSRNSSRVDRPFIGRQKQLDQLGEALEAAHRGKTATAFVHGRSGAGKSALVHQFLKQVAGRDDVVVLEGRCFEQESVAYKALDALIDALSRYLRRLSRLQVEAILPRDIVPLARVFPVLSRIDAVAEAPQRSAETPAPQELRRRAFAALRELLARIGDRHTLILYIDDLQWGDLDSAELISDLLQPPDAPVLLLLCCYRSEYASASPCLKRLLSQDEAAPATRRVEIEVGSLGPEEVRDLARLLLAQSGSTVDELVDVVARESDGSPFFVYELVHYLIQGGELNTGSAEVAGSLSLNEVLWRRVQELPPQTRRLLEGIAVAGQPIRQAIACRAAGIGSEGFSALAYLRANNLVKAQGGGVLDEVEAYHDRIRETIVRRLDPAAIAEWHSLLAQEMEEAGAADPETLAVFFASAGQLAKASGYFTTAADDAAKALAFERAAKLYRQVLDLRPADAPENLSVKVRLAEALANAGRSGEAAETYLAAASAASLEEAHNLQAQAAYQFLICGRIDEGQAAFHGVLARVGLTRPSTPTRALLALLKERLILACRGLKFRERSPDQISPAELTRVDISRAVAVGISVVDVIQGSYFQTRSLRLALRAGDPFRVALALGWEGVHSSCEGKRALRRTTKLISLADQVSKRVGHPHAIAMARLSAGAAKYMDFRFSECVFQIDEAINLLLDGCTGVVWELDTARSFSLWSRFYMGELKELARRVRAFGKEARDRGDRYLESNVGTYPGVIMWLAEDDPEAALNLATESLARWSQSGFHVQHLTYFYGRTYIDLYEGRGAAAHLRAEKSWLAIRDSLLSRIQHILIDTLQNRGRSALAAAETSRDREPLLKIAESMARKLDRQRVDWARTFSRQIRAGIASLRGNADQAARLLSESITLAEAEGLGLLAASAKRRLGRLQGGDAGRAAVAQADAWMTAQEIRKPARMARCIIPGFPED